MLLLNLEWNEETSMAAEMGSEELRERIFSFRVSEIMAEDSFEDLLELELMEELGLELVLLLLLEFFELLELVIFEIFELADEI